MTTDDVDWFWRTVEAAGLCRDRLRALLQESTKEQLYLFQDVFEEMATELQDEPYSFHLGPNESENGLEDAANWVVSQGRSHYSTVLADPSLMPAHVDVDDPANLAYVAYEVHYARFGEPLELRWP